MYGFADLSRLKLLRCLALRFTTPPFPAHSLLKARSSRWYAGDVESHWFVMRVWTTDGDLSRNFKRIPSIRPRTCRILPLFSMLTSFGATRCVDTSLATFLSLYGIGLSGS